MERNVVVDDLEAVHTTEIRHFCKVDGKVWNAEKDGSISIRSKSGDVETSIGLQDQDCACCVIKRHAHVWVGYTSGCIRVFSADTPSLVTELGHHEGPVLAFASSSSPFTWMFSSGQDGCILQWSATTFELINRLQEPACPVCCLHAFEARLFSGCDDGMLRCWDVAKASPTHWLKGHKGAVLAVCASYGDTIWSGSEDCVVRIWDMVTCRAVTTLKQHKGAVTCLANVGDFVLSGSLDRTICMWDSRSHQCIHSLAGHQGMSWCLALV